MIKITGDQIEAAVGRILESGPCPIVRFRLLRDCLCLTAATPELVQLKSKLPEQHWIKELSIEQHADGSWGRFHSQDTKVRSRFSTSEMAVRRALALGLDKDDPILVKASRYMQEVLKGKRIWSDRVERSEGWPIGVEAITAGTLAQVDPGLPDLDSAWDYWVEIASRTFSAGRYDQSMEIQAHKALRGLKIIYLRSRYVLTLLGARSDRLPLQLDRQIVDWIWNDPQGIGYLGVDLRNPAAFHINQWLDSQEILSDFRSWRDFARPNMEWLWEQRGEGGLWDFGPRISKTDYFPLSDDWRKPGSRRADHSTRVLALLRKFVG